MTLKELQRHYYIPKWSHNGEYLIHDKNEGSGKRQINKFLCTVIKKNNFWKVKDYPFTNKLEVLQENINDYINNLPYDSEYYDPRFSEESFVNLIIHDYLHSIGFKFRDGSFGITSYEYQHKTIYGNLSSGTTLWIYGLEKEYNSKELPKEITINLSLEGYSWMSVKTNREVELIKSGIDSLLKPYFISEGVNNIQTSDKLVNNNDTEIILKTLTNNLNASSLDYKKEIKKKLIALAECL